MPSVSKRQAKLMRAVAHDPEFADKVGIPQSVGKEFYQADKKRDEQRNAITRALMSRRN
jgi:hypothetical protein